MLGVEAGIRLAGDDPERAMETEAEKAPRLLDFVPALR
jgi:hypothetical protein